MGQARTENNLFVKYDAVTLKMVTLNMCDFRQRCQILGSCVDMSVHKLSNDALTLISSTCHSALKKKLRRSWDTYTQKNSVHWRHIEDTASKSNWSTQNYWAHFWKGSTCSILCMCGILWMHIFTHSLDQSIIILPYRSRQCSAV